MIRRTFGLRDILGTPKTRPSRRNVDVSPQLAALLHRQRKGYVDAKLAGRLAELLEYIFTEPEGGPLARRTSERAFALVLRKAGLGPQHSPKSLRFADDQRGRQPAVRRPPARALVGGDHREALHSLDSPGRPGRAPAGRRRGGGW
jgi:integrase